MATKSRSIYLALSSVLKLIGSLNLEEVHLEFAIARLEEEPQTIPEE